jgi:glycerol-3-phosphate O-acyltransferase
MSHVNGLLARVAERYLSRIPVDGAWRDTVSGAAARGPIVFVLRSASLVDYLAVVHLAERFGLPPVRFASEVPRALRVHDEVAGAGDADKLERTIEQGGSAILFLRRSPGLVSLPRLGERESDDALLRLLAFQDRSTIDVMMVPLTFIWSARSERRGFSLVDGLFGPTDMPGDVRAATQFFMNYKSCAPRAGEPLSLKEFCASDPEPSPARVRRLAYALYRKVERERRAVVGPARKAPDRVQEEVLRSPKLRHIMADMVKHGGADPAELALRARKMLSELSASPSPDLANAIEPLADKLVSQVYTGIDVDEEGLARLREAAKRGGVVLLPSHKSHVDYLILSYVLKKHLLELPLIASGDNLAFFPVGAALRRGGAFFIRRSFRGDKLYAAVVDAYIRRVMRDGWAIEFFLEGGRSRTGKLLPPQLGLLNLVVEAALELETRPLSFVPISIAYERTMEEVELVREKAGAPKESESARSLLAVGEALLEKYGRVNVQFGRVIDLAQFRAEVGADESPLTPAKRRALVTKLAHTVMAEINRVTPITAGALVAMTLLDMAGRGLAHEGLVARASRLLGTALRAGARPARTLTSQGPDGPVLRESSIREATLLFVRSGLVKQHVPDDTLTRSPRRSSKLYAGHDVVYTVPDEARSRLDLAKNAIIHFFVDRSIVSIAMLGLGSSRVDRGRLAERALYLAKLFAHEFIFRGSRTPEEAVAATIDDMIAAGELEATASGIAFGSGPPGDGFDGARACAAHARHLDDFIEAYRVAARTLRVLVHGPLGDKELSTRALAVGRQMFLGGEIDRREAVSRPTIDNAFHAFVDLGYVKRSLDRIELAPDHRSPEAVRRVEAEIASHQRANRSGRP